MAWALKFDGVNDYAELATTIIPSDWDGGDWVVECLFQSFRTISDNCFALAGNGINDMFGYHYNSGTQSLGWRQDGTWVYFGSGIDPITSPIKVKVERIGSVTSVYSDDVFLGTSSRSRFGFTQFLGGAIRGAAGPNFPTAQEVQYIKLQSTNFDHYLDATASSHSAGTPILVDTVGTNNATGVNMPTDGSAWIDLGGGGTQLLVDNSSQEQVLGITTVDTSTSIAPDSTFQLQVTDNATLSAGLTLPIDNSTQEQLLQTSNVDTTTGLSSDNSLQEQFVTVSNINTNTDIVSDNSLQEQILQTVSVDTKTLLPSLNSFQIQTTSNVNLGAGTSLDVSNTFQDQSLQVATLDTITTLLVNSSFQDQVLQSGILDTSTNILVDSLTQQQFLSTTILDTITNIIVNNSLQTQFTDNVSISTDGTLSSANLVQEQVLQQAIVDTVTLITIANLSQEQAVTNVTLDSGLNLPVDNLTQQQILGMAILDTITSISSDNLSQVQTTDNVVFVGDSIIVDTSYQEQYLETVVIIYDDTIYADNSLQLQFTDTVFLGDRANGYLTVSISEEDKIFNVQVQELSEIFSTNIYIN